MSAAADGSAIQGSEGFEVSFTPAAAALHEVRRGLEAWLAAVGAAPAVGRDLVTAASELCTNAIGVATLEVSLRARVEDGSIILEVRDDGPGFESGLPEGEPDPLADNGRGLFLTRQLVDVLWVSPDPRRVGTVARVARRL